jgi:hypothetical protein
MKKESKSGLKIANNMLHPYVILAIVLSIIIYMMIPKILARVEWTLLPLVVAFTPVYVYTLVEFRRLQRVDRINTGMRDTFRERPWELLIAAFIFGIPPILLIHFLSGPDEILALFVAYTASMSCLALLNFVYRASFHLALVTTSLCALWILTGAFSLVTLPLIFLAGFLRRRLGVHTVGQLLIGTILGVVVTLLVFYAFGFIR